MGWNICLFWISLYNTFLFQYWFIQIYCLHHYEVIIHPFQAKAAFWLSLFFILYSAHKEKLQFCSNGWNILFLLGKLQQNSCFSTMTTRLCLTLVKLYHLSTLCTNIVHSILKNYSWTARAFSEVCVKQVSLELLTLLNIHTGIIWV